MDVVFCGGVHGVGKTRFCGELATMLNARHVSAGSLLVRPPEAPPAKPAADFELTQWRILQEFERTAADHAVVLDGHFCLISENAQIECVPQRIFSRLAPYALILLLAEREIITTRLRNRDGFAFDDSLIEPLQIAEAAHARAVSEALGIPLHVQRSNHSVSEALDWLKSLRG